MTRQWTAAVALLTCLAPACEAPPTDSDFVRTDSAGVPILESFRPLWQDGNGWMVFTEPELAIGAGPMGGDDPNHPPWGFIRDVSPHFSHGWAEDRGGGRNSGLKLLQRWSVALRVWKQC